MIHHTKSAKETQKIAENIAKKYKKRGVIIALTGELGAGKTTFTQGFAKGLGIKDKVISPTFVLIRQHPVPESELVLYHLDLYRLEGEINTRELGISELFDEPNAIVLIEWAEKIEKELPENALKINFRKAEADLRIIEVT